MWKWFLLLIFTVLFAGLLIFGRTMVLVPAESIRIVADMKSINSREPEKKIAMIPKGQSLRVIGCRNLVHDKVFRMITDNGVEGYVAGGRFVVERQPIWESLGEKIIIYY